MSSDRFEEALEAGGIGPHAYAAFLHGDVLRGDEEGIETCSDSLFPVLKNHFSVQTGELDIDAAGSDPEVVEVYNDLSRKYDQATLSLGFTDAMKTLNLFKNMVDYEI